MKQSPLALAIVCLVLHLVFLASAFSQKLAWTFDVMPGPNDQTVTLNNVEPYVSAKGDILIAATWFKAPSGGYQSGFIWLSSKGTKLAEFRSDIGPFSPSFMRILNLRINEVCILLSDLGGFYIRTYKRVGSTLTLLRSAAITEFDENTRIAPENAYNRRDASGIFVFQSIRDSQGNIVGTKLSRYLF